MYRTKTIAVDHGNRNIKTENQIFTSGLVESDTEPPLGDFLSYNKKYYTLSQQRIPYMRDKTKDDRFFILTLFGIGMELELEGQRPRNEITKVNLPVGLPPAHYGSLYKKFERYFKREGIIQFSFRRNSYSAIIGDVVSYPQDYAAAMTIYPEIKRHTKVRIFDIGGFSVDYLELKNGVPDMNICDSLENGVITLYNRIKSRVNSEYDLLLSESEIDDIIQGKKTDFNEQIQGLVRNITKTFVDDLLGAFRERSMDLRTGCVVFDGGGALLLREHLERSEKVEKAIFIPEITANARGYAKLYNLSKVGR